MYKSTLKPRVLCLPSWSVHELGPVKYKGCLKNMKHIIIHKTSKLSTRIETRTFFSSVLKLTKDCAMVRASKDTLK